MPLRPLNRKQAFLLPSTLGEPIPDDHPVRFVAEFVDNLDRETLIEIGIGPEGEPLGGFGLTSKSITQCMALWFYDRDILRIVTLI